MPGPRRRASRSGPPTAWRTDRDGLASRRRAFPDRHRSCAGPIPPCTPPSPGRSGNMRASRRRMTSNAFYRRNLAAGQKGLSVAFDLADPPRLRFRPPAGRGGRRHGGSGDRFHPRHASRSSTASRSTGCRVSMTMNGAVLPIMALYIVAAEEQRRARPSSFPAPSRTTSSKNSWCATPTSTRPTPSMRIVSDIFAYTSRQNAASSIPSRFPATTCRRPGATADLELAYTLADGVDYIRAGLVGWPRHRRLRAAPVVLLRHRHELRSWRWRSCVPPGCSGPSSWRSSHRDPPSRSALRTHCQTSGWSLTAQDVFNNVDPHGMVEAMAATAGRHAVAPHQRARRGPGAADRFLRPHRPQHAARAAARGRRHPGDRPVGRFLLPRAADGRSRGPRVRPHRRGRGARRHGQGHCGGVAEASHRGSGRPAPRPASIRASRSSSASIAMCPNTSRRSTC